MTLSGISIGDKLRHFTQEFAVHDIVYSETWRELTAVGRVRNIYDDSDSPGLEVSIPEHLLRAYWTKPNLCSRRR